ncbi:NADPH dehydrogenase [Xylaria sp. CBS 124048]|nr:NADPH dehydrogenase [Xylaria sp. CBS 124048]
MPSFKPKAAEGVPFYTPAQEPPVGAALNPATAPTLYQPLKIRDLTLHNRFIVSPMCQYSADNGHLTDWHFVHLGQLAIRGSSLIIIEATAVQPNGRITPQDSGLWQDSQIAPLKRIIDFAHSQGQKVGIQLAHAGRKASTVAPWLVPAGAYSVVAPKADGGWEDNVVGPSAIRFSEGYAMPREMSVADIKEFIQAFKDATRRAVAAGVDLIEIHGAHGYLITEFLSPITNQRTDAYGGSFEGRIRFLMETVAAAREVMPASMPLFVRISATEWMEYTGAPSWTLDDTIRLAKLLPAAGVDLLDVSSGANAHEQKIVVHPYYQVDLAGAIRDAIKKEGLPLLIGAVGMITNAEMARDIVQEGNAKADVVLLARQLLREPEFPLRSAHQLGVEVAWPNQYHRAHWNKHTKL